MDEIRLTERERRVLKRLYRCGTLNVVAEPYPRMTARLAAHGYVKLTATITNKGLAAIEKMRAKEMGIES